MDSDMAVAVFMLVVGLLVIVASIVAGVFFLLTLQRALKACAPQNRTIEPGKVWLCFVPLFNLVWIFLLIGGVAESLRREFESREKPQPDYGRGVGIAYAVMCVLSLIPFVNIVTGLPGFVCWIVYWSKIATLARMLQPAGSIDELAEEATDEAPHYATFGLGKAWLALIVLMFASGADVLLNISLSWFRGAIGVQMNFTMAEQGMLYSVLSGGMVVGFIVMTVVTALCGTRWGVMISLIGMALAGAASGMAPNYVGLLVARGFLGLFAAGLLPAAIQSLRECFPAKLRTLAISLFLISGGLASLAVAPFDMHVIGMNRQVVSLALSLLPLIAAAAWWLIWQPPARRPEAGGVTTVGVISVVMIGVGLLLTAPLHLYIVSWLPMLVQNSLGENINKLPAVTAIAGIAGTVIAGAAVWVMMLAGVKPWKARAILFTVFGVLLLLAGLLGAVGANFWVIALASALAMAAIQGCSMLLYSAVADTLPARGVCIGAAIGSLISSIAWLVPAGLGMLVREFGYRGIFGSAAGLAVAAALCIILLAWLVRPKPAPVAVQARAAVV